MTTDLTNLSESELQAMIAEAQRALRARTDARRKDVLAEIRQLAASIGVAVEIVDTPAETGRRGGKVPVKYRDPANPAHQWSGRGVKPRWLQQYLDAGRSLDEFTV